MTPRRRWLNLLLPIGLGAAGVILLIRINSDSAALFPQDVDLVVIIGGLSLATLGALLLILREGMEHIRQQSILQMREDTLAEHRRFLRRLDHELKNPLTAFHAGLGTLALMVRDPEQQQIVQTLQAEAQRLSHLVNNLRKLAELDMLPLEMQRIDLIDFFNEIQEFEKGQFHAHDFQMQIALPAELPPFYGDPDLLLLAVHNLLDNAFKYTRAGDQVVLHAAVVEGDLLITVQDSGVGILPQETALVWEELYRGTNTAAIPGSGIGLALVKAIIERHHGSVTLHSEPSVGTTITLRLPLF